MTSVVCAFAQDNEVGYGCSLTALLCRQPAFYHQDSTIDRLRLNLRLISHASNENPISQDVQTKYPTSPFSYRGNEQPRSASHHWEPTTRPKGAEQRVQVSWSMIVTN